MHIYTILYIQYIIAIKRKILYIQYIITIKRKGEFSMNVILVNGSPHEKGCTYTALKEVEKSLNKQPSIVLHVSPQLCWKMPVVQSIPKETEILQSPEGFMS